MNWFNLRDLENRLSSNKVSDQEGFYYLLANLTLLSLTMYAPSNTYNYDGFLVAEIIIVIAVTIYGINATFKLNKNGDGSDYFKRFLALYFVIGVRLSVFVILLAIPAGILEFFIFGEEIPKITQDISYLVFFSGLTIVYYYLLVRSFKTISRSKPAAE